MTDEQINQRIAELCPSIHPRMDKPGCSGNYATDLNAMREAIMSHPEAQEKILAELWRITPVPEVIHEPRKYAEAFLRALGKWEE